MKNIGKYILDEIKNKNISSEKAKIMLSELRQHKNNKKDDIAIIGVSCKLPNCEDVEAFWENISHGRNCFVTKPFEKTLLDELYKNPYFADLFDHSHWKKGDENVEKFVGGFIKDFDKFDAKFFGIPPREAKYIDPQQRIFMEVVWSAIEDAGYSEKNIKNSMTGIYVGKDGTNSNMYIYHTAYDALSVSGNWSGILASRLNYIYNLKGPSMVIDTACSAGMVAIHEACAALRNNDCELAIAGGISLGAAGVDQENKKQEEEGDAVHAVVSDDNMIRTFDKNCSGTVFSEGCTVLLLKTLSKAIEDGDHIYSVIKGSAINSDGASNGLTAPNPAAQEEVIVEAWKRAQINPEEIDFVETHGTGTLLGDPIEILGLTNALKRYTDKKQFCGVGSVKTNLGHTVGAAGVTNVLKLALAFKYEVMPPTRNFSEPNPHIDFVGSPVYVVDQPIPWKRGEKPRIAGASAWGFSGTNGHLILAEAPVIEKEKSLKILNFFTISAKSETAIRKYIEKYFNFFQKMNDLNFGDICFTSNEGRGHYSYRICIFAEDYNNLKEKITYLYENGLDTYQAKGIYYNVHQVIPSKKTQKVEGDITENELNEESKKSNRLITDLINESLDSNGYKIQAQKLCLSYVRGANVDWKALYQTEKRRRISLPTYPFDRISYWGDKRDIQIKEYDNVEAKKFKNDFIDSCLVETMKQSIYLLKFDLRRHWPLQEHVLIGNNIVSGTTYIEIIRAALESYYDSKSIIFNDIVFLNTLIVTNEEPYVEGHLIIDKNDAGISFLLVSKKDTEDNQVVWTEHVKGHANIHSDKPSKYPTITELKSNEKLQKLEKFAISEFGERWDCTEQNYLDTLSDNKEFYSIIKLSNKYLDDLNTYSYHPGMLDNAVNMIIMQLFTGTDFYIPFTYKSMKIFDDLPAYFYSKIKKFEVGINSEVLAFSVTLIDSQGNLLAEIEECTIKKVSKFNEYFSSNFYRSNWIEMDFNNNLDEKIDGNVLVFADSEEVADTLINQIKTLENKVYKIKIADNYKKIAEDYYHISGTMDDYERFLIENDIHNISKIYHFATINDEPACNLAKIDKQLSKGLYSIVFMNKAFSKKIKGTIDFILVGENAYQVNDTQETISPATTSFFGITKALEYECPNFNFHCIDIDRSSNKNEIIQAVKNATSHYKRIAVRKNIYYSEIIEQVDTKNTTKNNIDIIQGGVYLITGGTSGLGLEMASNLSDFSACTICLVGRRKIADREQWDQLLIENSDKKLCHLIKTIRKIEAKGSQVFIRSSDVGNLSSMRTVVDELILNFGQINGVIHCAGVAGEGFNLTKSLEVFNEVINPKIYGSLVLAETLKDISLDFFVLFSSMTSILGGPGQGDYTAANAFLDSFSYYLRGQGVNAQTINWPGWNEIGMAADYQVNSEYTLFKSLAPKLGVSIFNRIVRTDLTNIIPGEINYEFIQKIGKENLPVTLSSQLSRSFDRYSERNKKKNDNNNERSATISQNIMIIGNSDGEYTETERTIAFIYAGVLNIEQIDIFDNFSSLGGDSIISTEVFKLLDQQYKGLLSISDIFLYPTVESIAEHVDSLLIDNKEEHQLEKTFSTVIEDFEKGDSDIDSILEFFEDK